MIAVVIVIGLTAGVLGGWLREPGAPGRPLAQTRADPARASPEPGPMLVVFVPPKALVGELTAGARPGQSGDGEHTQRARPRRHRGFREWPRFGKRRAQQGYGMR